MPMTRAMRYTFSEWYVRLYWGMERQLEQEQFSVGWEET